MLINYLCSLVFLVVAHNVADGKYAGIYFGGQFKPEEGCPRDGYYYNDETSFVRCVKSVPYVQKCPSGTANRPLNSLDADNEHSRAVIFCSLNLLVIKKVNTVPAVRDAETTVSDITEKVVQPTESLTEAQKVTEATADTKTNSEERSLPESKDMPEGESDIGLPSTEDEGSDSNEDTASVEIAVKQAPISIEAMPADMESNVSEAPSAEEVPSETIVDTPETPTAEAIPMETVSNTVQESTLDKEQDVGSVESPDENGSEGKAVVDTPKEEPETTINEHASENANQEHAVDEEPTVRAVQIESSDESQEMSIPPNEDEIDMDITPKVEEHETPRYPDPPQYEKPYERKAVDRGHSEEPTKEEIPKVPRYREPNHPKNPYRRPYHPAYHRPFYLPSELDQYHERDYYDRVRYNRAMYYSRQENIRMPKREAKNKIYDEPTHVNMRRAEDEDNLRKTHFNGFDTEQYDRANKIYEEQVNGKNVKYDNDRVYKGNTLYRVDRYPGPYEHPAGYRQENPFYRKYFSADH